MKKLKAFLCMALVLCMIVSIAPLSVLADNQPVKFTDIENWAADHGGYPHWATKWILYWSNQPAADGNGYVIGRQLPSQRSDHQRRSRSDPRQSSRF